MFLYSKSTLSALLFTSSVLASPLATLSKHDSLSTRAVINCTSLTAQRNAACWDSLKIADYLDNWRKTTPVCTESNNGGSDCCRPPAAETWSACYLRLTGGVYTCNNLDSQSCQLSNHLPPDERVDPAEKPQAYYVRATINQVRDFFIGYNTGARNS